LLKGDLLISEQTRILLEASGSPSRLGLIYNRVIRRYTQVYRRGHEDGTRFMKRMICNKSTGEFLSTGGLWAPEMSSARNFPDYDSAIAAQNESQLENLQIVLITEHLSANLEEAPALSHRRR
jgi:hypothetical protein